MGQSFASGLRLLASACLLLATAAPAATLTSSVSAGTYTRNTSGPTDGQSYNGLALPLTLTAGSSTGETSGPPQFGVATGASSSQTFAQSTAGALHLWVGAQARLTNVPFSAPMVARGWAWANSRFGDSFVISCAGLAACADGQTGTVTLGFLVAGNAGGAGYLTPTGVLYNGGFSGAANWAAGLNLQAMGPNGLVDGKSWAGGQGVRDSLSGPTVGDYNVSYPYASFGLKQLSLNFVFGSPIYLDMIGMVDVDAGVGYDSSGSAGESAFQSSLQPSWGGVLSIVTAGGVPITGGQGSSAPGVNSLSAFSTATGVNYLLAVAPAVPEPASLWLWLAGLLLAAGPLRRRLLQRP